MSCQSSPDLFLLPDGTPLAYSLIEDRGGQSKWYRTKETARLQNCLTMGMKRYKPLLGLDTGKSDQRGVLADFDYLPDKFSSWEDFHQHCLERYPNGLVFRSVSRKVKIAFVVEIPRNCINRLSKDIQVKCLEQLLDPEELEICDLHGSANIQTYLNEENYLDFKNLHKSEVNKIELSIDDLIDSNDRIEDIVIDSETDSYNIISCNSESSSSGSICKVVEAKICEEDLQSFKKFSGDFPENFGNVERFIENNKFKEALIRYLLLIPDLNTKKGFAIPNRFWGELLGVSHTTANNYLKELKQKKLLRVLEDKKFVIRRGRGKGEKGVIFEARGQLQKAIRSINKYKKSSRAALPKFIPDGMWEVELYKAAFHFNNALDYLTWAEKIPGYYEKDREKKARHIADTHFS